MRKCAMLLMDSTPLIFLAKIGRLELLLEFNLPIYLPQEVLFEVTEKQAFENNRKQNDEELMILNFIRHHQANGTIFVIKTIVCEIAEKKRSENPGYRSKGDGEVAANSLFLNRYEYGINGPALLLYEDADIEVVFNRNDVHFLTTYAALVAMEKIHVIESADAEWEALCKVYQEKNHQALPRRPVDRSNRGDTEYQSKIRRR